MPQAKQIAAIDIGASGGRVAAGSFDGDRLSVEVVHRFPNGPVELNGHWHWNAVGLYQGIRDGLARMGQTRHDLLSLGLDTWGVDFALLDTQGKLAGIPYCARDPQTKGIYDQIHAHISRQELFERTGVQSMEINSLCQLYAMQCNQDPTYLNARTFLTIPDLMNYWLTGEKACEYTNATTTQILDVTTREWSDPIFEKLGIHPACSHGSYLQEPTWAHCGRWWQKKLVCRACR